jgi:hypothetical protein
MLKGDSGILWVSNYFVVSMELTAWGILLIISVALKVKLFLFCPAIMSALLP